MAQLIHRLAAPTAIVCIALFFLATILVEIFGAAASIAQVKRLIVAPGLLLLVPSLILTGASGFVLARSRETKSVRRKMLRMRFIAANGVLVLVPSAIFLAHWASIGAFNTGFYLLQSVELLAGAINLLLMAMNMRDGLKISGRFHQVAASQR